VVQLQAAVIGEKRSQVEKETDGPKAQESAASSHIMQLLTKERASCREARTLNTRLIDLRD
jgi:hypothetical protein